MRGKLALVGLGLLAALVFSELALRLFYASRLDESTAVVMRRSEDPVLVFEMTPLAETERDDVSVRINADGYRDDPFPQTRAAGALRVLVIGDSVAAGMGVPMADAFPQVLERLLRADPPPGSDSADVFNMGVYGYATRQELRLLESRGLALDPDLVILEYHLNDADIADAGQVRYFTRPPLAWMELVRDAWARIRILGDARDYITRIQEDRADEVAAGFRELGAIADRSGVPVTVAVLPIFDWTDGYRWDNFHERLAELSEQSGLDVLDLRAVLTVEPQDSVTLDSWHPNARGHHIIAEALAGRVRGNAQLAGETAVGHD